MRDEPADLSCDDVAAWLRRYWGREPDTVEYAPVGFGGYHWVVAEGAGRCFVSIGYLDPDGDWLGPDPETVFGRLSAAADTTRALVARGCGYAVAPVPDRSGALIRRVRPAHVMQVFPYVNGWSTPGGLWRDTPDRARVADVLGHLHTTSAPPGVPRWDSAIPARPALARALNELDHPWDAGPYAERTRELLADAEHSIRRRLERYDEVAAALDASTEPWVVTHGEPHSANVIRTGDGPRLIDWDTVALAPRERDLAHILDGSPDVLTAYRRTAGPVTPRPAALELFALWWELAEICGYVRLFRRPHGDGADSAESWRNLCGYASAGRVLPEPGGGAAR